MLQAIKTPHLRRFLLFLKASMSRHHEKIIVAMQHCLR